jgi:adenylate kinase family enzyme
MARILITGNAGSGKTTLARNIASRLDYPVHSLDKIVWQPKWRKTPESEKSQQLDELINQSEHWVIDGVSRKVMDAADTIIFLDVSRWRCLLRCAKRNVHYLFRSRPDLPDRCPEILIVPQLLRIIWGFKNNVRPAILNALHENRHKKRVYVFSQGICADSILAQLAADEADRPRRQPERQLK